MHPENFQGAGGGRGGGGGARGPPQTFRQKHKKRRPHREIFWRYFPRHIFNGKFNPKIGTIFLCRIRTLVFDFQKG